MIWMKKKVSPSIDSAFHNCVRGTNGDRSEEFLISRKKKKQRKKGRKEEG